MPTYEYTCKKCGQNTEAVQSFHDAPLTVCPHCGGELRKVFGAVGITFKGSGFYKTDSRPRPKETAGSSSSDSKGSSSSDKTAPDKGSSPDKGSGSSEKTTGSSPKEGSGSGSPGSSNDSGSSTKTSAATKS
jgi:putative FmdB family regulatory protein